MFPLSPDPSSHPTPEPERILLVDDSRSAREVAGQLLVEAGFRVRLTSGGTEGLEIFRLFAPQVVVLDIHMPGMDGYEVCRQLRQIPEGKSVPILFLSTDEGREAQTRAIEAGGDDLVSKNALFSELLIRVRSLLRMAALNRQVQSERDAFRSLQERQENLFHFIVHDLKNPLQVILGITELLDEPDEPRELKTSDLARIRKMVHTMNRLIQDFLDVERSTHRPLVSRPQALSVAGEFLAWEGEIHHALTYKSQVFRSSCPPDLLVEADPDLLRRVFLNLLDNASKYGPQGGTIRLTSVVKGDRVILRVHDDGPGIPAELRARVFEPFFRLDVHAEEARVSSGLGLAFCRLAMEAQGGGIWIEDEATGGTTFCLELPIGY